MAKNFTVDLDNILIEGFDPEKFQEEEKQSKNRDWEKVIASQQNQKFLEGKIEGIEYDTDSPDTRVREKNAFAVVFMGQLKGRMHLEETGAKNIDQLRAMVGKNVSYVVKSYDKENDTFEPSRIEAKSIMASITVKKIQEGRIKEGSIIPAVATHVKRNKVTMDIGGINVDMPLKEIRHGHIANIFEEVKEEEVLKVKITNVDMDLDNKKLEISISAKEAQENPWSNIEKVIPVNSEKYGIVTGIDYDGAFVNLGVGIDAKAQHLKFQQPKEGDEVLVHVKNIDKKNQQIHCSIKRIQNK